MAGDRTRAIHVGEEPHRHPHGDVVAPLHMATTFAKESLGEVEQGYVYARTRNPTRDALEEKLAALEGARFATAYSSGMAAIATLLLALLKKGDTIVAGDDLYGGTRRLFTHVMAKFGVRVVYVDTTSAHVLAEALEEHRPRILWVETPSNPLLKITDLREASRLAHEVGALLVVDNTFATPVFQKPLELGADIVVHSLTKYIAGHSDVLGGALITNDPKLHDMLAFHQNAVGAVLGAPDAWLVLRGAKTLPLRMRVHEENARAVAELLQDSAKVKRVYYPGLPDHPGHVVARRQMRGYGGMVSADLGEAGRAARLVECLRLFHLAESLGGVESLVEIPALMTHASVPPEERRRLGIGEGLVRFSVGLEDTDDLVEDLTRCLEQL